MTPQPSQAPLLETRNLSRLFGHGDHIVKAVDNVSFAMQPGEILSVVGESGSGKSTLSRLILRLLEPTSGQLLIEGQDVTDLRGGGLKPYWQKIQGVFQDPFSAFNQFYTIGQVIDKAMNVMDPQPSKKERRERVDNALREVGLDPNDVRDKWPHQLSGGQVQRVMIARALVVGPKLLLADEPTSMLDASLRVTVLNLLLQLRERRNMGILFITHDVGQAYYLSDRALVMYHGQVVEQGPVERVLAHPQHEYTQRLLADVPRLLGWGPAPDTEALSA